MGVACRDVVGHQPVVRDVAEDQPLLVAEPYWSLGPDATGPDAHDAIRDGVVLVEARVETLERGIRIDRGRRIFPVAWRGHCARRVGSLGLRQS